MDETLVQLIKAMQDIAPQVWDIYMKQVMVDMLQCAVWAIAIAVFIAGLFEYRRNVEDMDDFDRVIVIGVGGVLSLLVLGIITELVGMAINPQYYAIQKLLEVISGQ